MIARWRTLVASKLASFKFVEVQIESPVSENESVARESPVAHDKRVVTEHTPLSECAIRCAERDDRIVFKVSEEEQLSAEQHRLGEKS